MERHVCPIAGSASGEGMRRAGGETSAGKRQKPVTQTIDDEPSPVSREGLDPNATAFQVGEMIRMGRPRSDRFGDQTLQFQRSQMKGA